MIAWMSDVHLGRSAISGRASTRWAADDASAVCLGAFRWSGWDFGRFLTEVTSRASRQFGSDLGVMDAKVADIGGWQQRSAAFVMHRTIVDDIAKAGSFVELHQRVRR